MHHILTNIVARWLVQRTIHSFSIAGYRLQAGTVCAQSKCICLIVLCNPPMHIEHVCRNITLSVTFFLLVKLHRLCEVLNVNKHMRKVGHVSLSASLAHFCIYLLRDLCIKEGK